MITYAEIKELLPESSVIRMLPTATHLILVERSQYEAMGEENFRKFMARLQEYNMRVIAVVCRDPKSAMRIFEMTDHNKRPWED